MMTSGDDWDIYCSLAIPSSPDLNEVPSIPTRELTLHVSDIHYTRKTIPWCFRHVTPGSCLRLKSTIGDFIRNQKTRNELPKLHVMRHDDKYWCVGGNRRLYVYRSLARIGYLQEVSVLEVEDNTEWYSRCCDTDSGGRVVSVIECDQEASQPNFNLCRRLPKEELPRRFRCHWCSWLVALSFVLAVNVGFLTGFALHRNQLGIVQLSCEEQQPQQPSTLHCECPVVEICATLPVMEFIRMKWNYRTNKNSVDSTVKDDL